MGTRNQASDFSFEPGGLLDVVPFGPLLVVALLPAVPRVVELRPRVLESAPVPSEAEASATPAPWTLSGPRR